MLNPEQAMENSYQCYLHHIRFVAAQASLNLPPEKRSPPCPEASIRRGWDAMCLRAGQRKEQSRKRAGVPLREDGDSKVAFDLGVAKQKPRGAQAPLASLHPRSTPGPPKPPALKDITI